MEDLIALDTVPSMDLELNLNKMVDIQLVQVQHMVKYVVYTNCKLNDLQQSNEATIWRRASIAAWTFFKAITLQLMYLSQTGITRSTNGYVKHTHTSTTILIHGM